MYTHHPLHSASPLPLKPLFPHSFCIQFPSMFSNFPIPSLPLPLLMLRIQRANDIDMSLPTLAPLPPNTLTTLTKLLNTTPNLHPSNLLLQSLPHHLSL